MKITNTLISPRKFNIDELISFLIKELGISDKVELMLIYNDRLLDMLSKGEVEYSALLTNPLQNQYVLNVRSGVSLEYILCHEFVHLQQFDRGDLKANLDYTEIIWKGEKYDSSISYEDREWEEEAFSKQGKLWRKFKKLKKQQKKNERAKS